MAVLKFLSILLILVLLPFGQIGKVDLGTISFTFFDLGVFLLVFYWLVRSIVKKEKINKGLLGKALTFFILIGFLSLLINLFNYSPLQLFISSSYLLRFILFAGIYLVFKSFDKSFNNKIIKYFFISGIIVLLIGFIQFIFYPNLRNLFYLGWDEHLYRLFSTFLDPNFAGIYFVIIFFTGIYLYKKENNFIYLVFALFTFIGIFLTYSRSALVFLIIAALTYLTIAKKKKLFIGFVSIAVLAIIILPKSFKTEGTNLFRTASINERITSMNRGLTVFIDNPLFGVGFNAYRYSQEKYGFIESGKNRTSVPNRAGAGVENSFIHILATTGIIGFFAYIYLLWNIGKLFFTKKNNIYSKTMFPIFIGLIVSGLFINSLFYTFFMFWIFMTAGIIESK
ncbi:MAG TPA: O-antigen ligase family protein [Patescibacteria group bacterium]|nr:O-antigen ligase family protein [Patescibacteria group bacterium]